MGADNRYICVTRSDLGRGLLQVLDLKPNKSQQNLVYDPPAQTKYLNRLQNDTVATVGSGPISTQADYKGVAAYLIDHVEAGGLAAGTAALTASEANSAAAAIVALVDAGSAVTLSAVNAAIAGVVADSELTNVGGSASTGDLEELLRILAGGEYLVPAGSVVDTDGSTFVTTVSGSFLDTDQEIYDTSAFKLSNAEGQLSKLKAATFEYDGTAGAAVVVYDNTGAVL